MIKLLCAVVASAVVACQPAATPPPLTPSVAKRTSPAERMEPLARGEYVATIAGCLICHSRPGMEMPLPNGGVLRMPNITPDPDTGIGAWSDAQIINAIRIGTRPDETTLSTMMPYPFFHRMTDSDAQAVVAFLRAQPPIRARVERSENLPMPPVTMPPAIGHVDPAHDRGHGEYLVALMHCGACHTKRGGAPFAGGSEIGDVVAANITSDPITGIGTWSHRDIVRAVREMKTPDGHDILGPMADYKQAWSILTDRDARAVAVFIKSLPSVRDNLRDDKARVSTK